MKSFSSKFYWRRRIVMLFGMKWCCNVMIMKRMKVFIEIGISKVFIIKWNLSHNWSCAAGTLKTRSQYLKFLMGSTITSSWNIKFLQIFTTLVVRLLHLFELRNIFFLKHLLLDCLFLVVWYFKFHQKYKIPKIFRNIGCWIVEGVATVWALTVDWICVLRQTNNILKSNT